MYETLRTLEAPTTLDRPANSLAIPVSPQSPEPTPSSSKPDTDPLADLQPPVEPLPVLIRATDGKGKATRTDKGKKTDRRKVKLSTVVQHEDLEGFFTKYAEVCKAGMSSGLKKRDRKAKEKKKKKGKGGTVAGTENS